MTVSVQSRIRACDKCPFVDEKVCCVIHVELLILICINQFHRQTFSLSQ